jgi:hypothetical protein
MTTYVPRDTSREKRVREAWIEYLDRLVGLEGPEYEAAEEACWRDLQHALRVIERDGRRTRR